MSGRNGDRKLRWDAVAVVVALALAAGNTVATNWHRFGGSDPAVWQEMKLDTTYEAESDGFVVVFSHGSAPFREATIHEGPSSEALSRRARLTGYNSLTLPVRKGRYWRANSVGSGSLGTVFWTDAP